MKDQQEAEKKKVTSMDIQATIEVYIELLSPLKPYINMHILPTVAKLDAYHSKGFKG